MKNLINYLNALWRRGLDSQSTDVRHDCRLTVGSPSGLESSALLKFVSVLVLVLTIGVGHAWGADASITSFTATSGNIVSGVITYSSTKVSTNGPEVVSSQLKLYRKGKSGGLGDYVTVTAVSPAKITSITFTLSSSLGYSYQVDAASAVTGTNSSIAITSINASSVKFQNNSSSQMFVTGISVTYSTGASCTTNPTVSAGGNSSVTATTATVSCSGISSLGSAGCTISSYGFVIGGSANPAIGGSGVTKHEVGTSYTTVNTSFSKNLTGLSPTTTYYVRPYATNGNGTAYGPQTSFTTESKGCEDKGASSITSGASSSSDYGPLHAYYDYSTSQILYTKSDLDLAAGKKGTIKSIFFEYSGAAAMAARSIKIYMANTALTELTTSSFVPYASFTEVYDGSFSCSSAGWYEITFDTPFEYNGVGNLAVMVDDNTNNYESSKTFKYHSATGAQVYKRQDDTDIDPASWTPASAINYRPNTKFCIQEADMTPATVTLKDNDATLTEASAGAGVTLPSRTGCSGYTFAGWTKSWVTAQTSWTTTAPTIIPAGTYYPTADEDLYPVYTKTEGGGSPEFSQYQQVALGGTITAGKYLISTGSYTMAGSGKTGVSLTPGTTEAAAREYTVAIVSGTTITIKGPDNKYIGGLDKADGLTFSTTTPSSDDYRWVYTTNGIQNKSITGRHIKAYSTTDFRHYGTGNGTLTYFYKRIETSGSTTSYISVPACCTDPELSYGTASVTKTFGNGTFKNTLTNSHSVSVTYESSNTDVATVASDGTVTIQGAGNATITARFAGNSTYCADEASYTLTVNKANISPTLTYTPSSVAAGSSTSAPTVGGNPGGGGVTYAITSATPSGCATINTSTGVVSGEAVGSVTVTATVAATTNYNGGTATANVTITAASGYCISAFNSSNNGITSGFSNGGSGNEYTLSYTIPGKDGSSNWPQYWIGENEAWASFSANALFADMHFTHSDATLGLAEGATGKLHIWDDNKASGSNLWVKFEPDGYGFRWGGAGEWDQAANTKAFTVDPGNANTYWTEIVTLDGTNNTTWNYYVGLQSASGYVYSGVDNEASDSRGISRTRSVTTMKVSNGTAGSYKATYLNSEATGTRGKFRIWDNNISDHNFVCHFVPYYRVTYNGSGASGSTDPSADVSCEGNDAARTVVAAANGFTVPTGKTFGGWASSPENAAAGVVAYAAGANVVLTSSITLYAIWTDINYTVTVNQNPSVGATTTGQTTTAHYNGAINLTTTVPSGYRFVNWTTSDGFSMTNPTSATTASFTMPAKNVTVTANFQQTHKVDWYVGGSAVGNKLDDDGQTTVVDHGGKIEDFPAHDPDGSACEKTFVGWTNTSSYVHGTSPLFNDVAGSPTINANASFYAVFAEDGGSSYVLVESDLGTDWAGDYLIAYSSTVFADGRVGGTGTGGMGKQYQKANPDDKLDGKVVDVDWGDTYHVTLEEISSNSNTYLLKTQDGLYNYVSSNSNGLSTTSTRATAALYPITVTFTSSSDVRLGLGGSAAGAVFRYNASEYFRYYANCTQNAVYLYKKTGGYTGHTINCADCGSSVTPTYTASPTGGTVSVTKSATPVASGSTVKTCTAVDLTVTITPATHYTLTGFTATGLTTGTATISPAVNTVVPTTSEQTFTVTVSAGATGTLNLTPTFTAQTPLTITLSTNSKGSFTAPTEFPIYAGETFTFPDVTPNDPTCATFVGWIAGTTFVGDGTTHDAPATIAASTVSDPQNSNATYTAVFYETETSESDAYVKVTSTPANWANDHYLIVYEDGGVAFDGSRTDGDGDKIDAASNTVAVSITSSAIAATNALAASEWKIALISGSNYSIQSASGKYIGNASNSNALSTSSSALANTLSISSGDFEVVSDGGAYLRYNATSGQERFRYYKSSSYSSQQAIQLYKLGTAVVETRTYTTNPSCTPKYRVTVASVTGGSPNANPKFNPEGDEVTLTAHPAAGYSFTGWTITHTEGGAAASVTYTTGSASTETAVFEMPAYDVTVTAMYAKKMVTELKVMDGSTVVANTTGPVSGTLNVSTGANKTLDVVVTPSDAYDHSWTATVSAGGTYASITNVTDDGFRVNGLAQGDATITVTAPNDEANGGTPKVVTFTVHVTDILPEEIILKRDGSNTPIETLIMYYDASESKGQYVKVNVSYSPSNPTNKAFTFSSAATGKVGSHSHSNNNGYEVLVANGVTTDPVNCTFTSSANGSVTKVLAVTVLPILTDRFVDYVHGNATQTVSARLSADRYTMITDINTPSLSDASDANPTSEDCETAHYHLIGWLPQATAEALMAAGTPITDATEGLVRAGVQVEATGQTWCAIWAEEQ